MAFASFSKIYRCVAASPLVKFSGGSTSASVRCGSNWVRSRQLILPTSSTAGSGAVFGKVKLSKNGTLIQQGESITRGLNIRSYHLLAATGNGNVTQLCSALSQVSIASSPPIQPCSMTPELNISRSVTKFSLRKGRRKTVNAVRNRFYRLEWGGWISPQPGRHRHLWRKHPDLRLSLREHIFRSHSEANLLDQMCTKYWIKKKYYVDDPYESYQRRDNFKFTKGLSGIKTLRFRKPKKHDINRPIA